MYTEYGYIGRADGILYATELEAREANEDNPTRAARPPPFPLFSKYKTGGSQKQ